MDLNDVNNSKDIYLNTIAEYLEYTLHQERGLYNHDKVTILVDIRPGRVSIVDSDYCFKNDRLNSWNLFYV
jgi:hypothetical protein